MILNDSVHQYKMNADVNGSQIQSKSINNILLATECQVSLCLCNIKMQVCLPKCVPPASLISLPYSETWLKGDSL